MGPVQREDRVELGGRGCSRFYRTRAGPPYVKQWDPRGEFLYSYSTSLLLDT